MSNDSMQIQKQQMSVLMDGELPEMDARRLLEGIARDPQLKQHWTDMHTARVLLHPSARPVLTSAGFAERVSAAIAQEPAILAPRGLPKVSIPFWGKAGAAAMAASVAAISLFLLPTQSNQISVSNVSVSSSAALQAAAEMSPTAKVSQWSPVNLPTDSLDQYLAKHRAMEANMEWLKATSPKTYN